MVEEPRAAPAAPSKTILTTVPGPGVIDEREPEKITTVKDAIDYIRNVKAG